MKQTFYQVKDFIIKNKNVAKVTFGTFIAGMNLANYKLSPLYIKADENNKST